MCACVCLGLVSVFLFLGYFDQFDLILLSFEIGVASLDCSAEIGFLFEFLEF